MYAQIREYKAAIIFICQSHLPKIPNRAIVPQFENFRAKALIELLGTAA
jgi:hypothetical protein